MAQKIQGRISQSKPFGILPSDLVTHFEVEMEDGVVVRVYAKVAMGKTQMVDVLYG